MPIQGRAQKFEKEEGRNFRRPIYRPKSSEDQKKKDLHVLSLYVSGGRGAAAPAASLWVRPCYLMSKHLIFWEIKDRKLSNNKICKKFISLLLRHSYKLNTGIIQQRAAAKGP